MGVLWNSALLFAETLKIRLNVAAQHFKELRGLVAAGALPLQCAVILFESKVDGSVSYGRWLTVLCPDAESMYNTYFNNWALDLLGAPRWRRPASSCSELGWATTGFGRALKDMCSRLAKISNYGDEDIYRQSAVDACQSPFSWTASSLLLLRKVGLDSTWNKFIITKDAASFKREIASSLRDKARADATQALQCSSVVLPYLSLQVPASTLLCECRQCDLDWDVQIGVLSFCRMRASLVELGKEPHQLHGKKSWRCIFCNTGMRNPLIHVVGKCVMWQHRRDVYLLSSGLVAPSPETLTVSVLTTKPQSEAFSVAVRMCVDIDTNANNYWSTE